MVEHLEGTVEQVRYVNEESHWTVAGLKVDGEVWPSPLVGTLPGLAMGMRVRVQGEWVDDPRWGRQFRASRYVEVVPASAQGIQSYLASGFIQGIGDALAERIVDRFGEQALQVIEGEPRRLLEVSGLGKKKLAAIQRAFQERRGAQEAMVFLYDLGLTPGLVNRIYRRYGDRTMMVVRANPWRLAEEVHGVGFHKADQVARGLEIDPDAPERIRAGAYHLLLEARGSGHCFLTRTTLTRLTADLTGVGEELAHSAIDALAGDGRVCLEHWAVDSTDQAVYLETLHHAETGAALELQRLIGADGTTPADLNARVERAARSAGVALSEGQIDAIRCALGGGVVIVTGGPGTGKTTLITALLDAADLPDGRVELAAPTGRAAKRMAEATGREARTLHRLLEFSPTEGVFQRNAEHPLTAELVVVDEASMVDVALFHSLAQAIPEYATLVLVGDSDQLPPVGPGAPFIDLIRSETVPAVRLQHIFRQGRGSEIVINAHQVNEGLSPEVTPPGTPIQDFYFIHREDPEDILATIEEVVTRRAPERFGLDPLRELQVLSPMRHGVIGVGNLNERLQALLNPGGMELQAGAVTFREGDRVMQTRNDYDRGVFNGDTGFIARVDPKDRRLIVTVDGEPVVYEKDQLDDLVLAYAVSVHKSQGSEYPGVVIPISTQHFKMLQRNLLYTAITRGRRLVVLVGTPKAVGIAVRNKEISLRNTQLSDRLLSALGRRERP